MALSRRSFLKTTGAVVATPAILSAQVDAHLTQTQQINMEIKRVGSQPSIKGIQEQLDCKVVEWMEKVSDDQYRR